MLRKGIRRLQALLQGNHRDENRTSNDRIFFARSEMMMVWKRIRNPELEKNQSLFVLMVVVR
jgi:hypothetical protein